MKKETILLVVVTLVVGLLVVILVNQSARRSRPATVTSPQAVPQVDYQKQIQMLERVVADDPGNSNAWVELGHLYFDLGQHMQAVEAYDKALELQPSNPNVLTDQGVMFRRLGWYDRAVGNFLKAQEVDPTHPQSMFNLGVVYRYDLQDFPKAREVWKKFLTVVSTGPTADQVRAELRALETLPAPPPGR
ncbi:MAG: hypothetical protein C0617_05380 [Desulfuromonas sp.]|uniref:tetratricopeptide repeat protein n=1 Tax=Desulfuromonas sp. TaxID=892 RepID=UPI000CC52F1A|nr:tetratricopeptide repeat protein [Desulfuromonas sp.]PLX85120.1 MAG: hypothetical protein C0617_05380 [Desulfuromonas sp.]